MTRPRYRRAVSITALLAVAALLAASCANSTESTTQAPTTSINTTTQPPSTTAVATTEAVAAPTTTAIGGIQPGGEAIVGSEEEPTTLNRFAPGGSDPIVTAIGQTYLVGVYEVDGRTRELIPELVTELPTVSNGGVTVNDDGTMTVRYNIREEAIWSDGTPITGADFQFTLSTILNSNLQIDKTTYEDIIDSTHGDKTFEFTLAEATMRYELLFDTIIPRHAVEGSDFASDWNDAMWVSGGPFVFDEWVRGDYLRVVRNENYWKKDPETGAQLPYLDSIRFQFITKPATVVDAFVAREVDIMRPVPTTETIATLRALEPDGAVVEVLSGPRWEHLNFQFGPGRLARNPNSANDNLNYRKAVAHAIDKQFIVSELLAGQVAPLDSFVEVYTPAISLGAWSQYDYNPEGAARFVEAAKAETGKESISVVFSTTSNNDARVKLSELFVDMFLDVGMEYENQLEDSQIFFGETVVDGEWDLGQWAWLGSPGYFGMIKALDVWDPNSEPPGGSNFYQWGTENSSVIDEQSARFAEIRDQLDASVDAAVLLPLLQEAERILADNVVIIPLYSRMVAAAVWGDEIGGFKHNPTTASFAWNAEYWHRVDR